MGSKSDKSAKRARDEPTAVEPEATDAAAVPAEAAPKKHKEKKSKSATTESAPSDEPVASTSKDVAMDDAPAAEPAAADDEPEVPALSHKEKRLAKRRKLAGIEDPVPETKPKVGTSSRDKAPIPGTIGAQPPAPVVGATPAKGSFGIWLGNMNFATTSKDLLAWFENRGLREIVRINMPKGKRANEANKG